MSDNGNVPGLRDRIALLIRRNTMKGIAAESTAEAIVRLLDQEAAERCRDPDCARILPHGRLSAHLWRHPAEAPFDRVLLGWLFLRPAPWHRIHKGRAAQPARERTTS